ncbi:MAG: hypothetical protein IKL73_04535 [Lachnospiraceae bacterium]|nr:hypothetical protein [Lachnospiraceae bacterium]
MRQKRWIKKLVSIVLIATLMIQCVPIKMGNKSIVYADTQPVEASNVVPQERIVGGYYDIGYKAPYITETDEDKLLLKATKLDSSYSSVDKGYITFVKNQSPYGTCWAFAAVACMEAYAIKNGFVASASDIDLSEYALAYLTFDDSAFIDDTGTATTDKTTTENMYECFKNGGNDQYVLKTLSKWAGLFEEEDMPYSTPLGTEFTYDASKLDYILTGQHFISMANIEYVKRAIMEYGAVSTYYNADEEYDISTPEYYCYYHYTYKETYTNHAIAIVGWDDTIPKENFTITDDEGVTHTPANDGAWLIKNSWGPYYGASGYMWISYDDMTIKNADACAYEIAPKSKYTYNYQHDGSTIPGHCINFATNKYANVFTVKGNASQDITAVAFGIDDVNRDYSIQIYLNPEVDNPKSGTPCFEEPVTGELTLNGYYTIKIPKMITVEPGDTFSVVLEFTENTMVYTTVPGTTYVGGGGYATANSVTSDNESYVFSGENVWDIYELAGDNTMYNVNLCIKALAVDHADTIQASDIISLENDGTDAIIISWQEGLENQEYILLRATQADGLYSEIYRGTATTYTDSDVTLNSTYYYKVRVYDGETELDSQAKSIVLALDAPALTDVSTKRSGIIIAWDGVDEAEGYNIYRSLDGVLYELIDSVESDIYTYTDTDTDYDVWYFYVVKAYIMDGENKSESVASNMLECMKCVNPPLGFSARSIEYGKVKLSWAACEDVDGYKIYRSYTLSDGTNIVEEEAADLGPDATEYICDTTDIVSGQNAKFLIAAYVQEDGVYQFSVKPDASVYISYGPVENIKWYVGTNGLLYITWDEYVATNMTVTSYIAYIYNDIDGTTLVTSRVDSTLQRQVYTTIDPMLNYYVTVYAKNAMHTEFTMRHNPLIKIGGAMQEFSVLDIADVEAEINANVTLTANMKDELENFAYKYQWYEATENDSIGTAIEGAISKEYTPDTSTNGTRYYYCLVSGEYNGTKTSTSNIVKVCIGKPEPTPEPIEATTITNIVKNGIESFTIEWAAGIEGQEFELLRAESEDGEYQLIYKGAATTFTDAVPLRNKTYYYKVRVYDGENALDSEIVSDRLQLLPTTLTEITFVGTDVTISWDEVNNVTGYNVYRSVDGIDYELIATVNETSYTDMGISYDTNYYYIVRTYYEGQDIEESDDSNTLDCIIEKPKVSLNDCEIDIEGTYTYDGSPIEADVVITDGDYILLEDIDYTLSYSDNINAGNATITIEGIGDYIDTIEHIFVIAPKNISSATVTDINDQIYKGSEVIPLIEVYDGNETLEEDVDYYLEYTDNDEVGKATITVYGKGNYTGNVVKTFNIIEDKPPVPENITSTKFSISQDELIVSKVTVGTTVSDLLNGIEQEEYVKVYSKSGILQAKNAALATGMTIRLMDEDEIIKSYTIIVTGDTNGDGTINITDMMAAKAHVLKKTLLTGNASLAGDTNGDGKINITDFMAIKAHILKKTSIQGVAIN